MQNDINIELLPEEARKLLIEFYEFLLNRYKEKKEVLAKIEDKKRDFNKQKVLKKILSEPVGILPEGYKFDREEAHER